MDDYINVGKKMVIYTYSTRNLLAKDKVRFFYALKGRNGKSGILKSTKSVCIGKSVLLVHYTVDEEFQNFFKLWNLPYTRRKVVVEDTEEIIGMP